jgi:hypothetical protein
MDGERVTFLSDRGGNFDVWETRAEVYVSPFPEVSSGKWLVSLGGGGGPRWERSGRTLFFDVPGTLVWCTVNKVI